MLLLVTVFFMFSLISCAFAFIFHHSFQVRTAVPQMILFVKEKQSVL